MKYVNRSRTADGEVVEERFYVDGQEVDQATFEASSDLPSPEERIAALEAEVRGMKERSAAADVSDPDARKVADAVAGKG